MEMSVWYLVGAVLVFFMQCGFAMVETGFTRAKNAGNIIMKNLMDFCIGTVVFMFLGYGIINSEHYFFGLIGMPEYGHRIRKGRRDADTPRQIPGPGTYIRSETNL